MTDPKSKATKAKISYKSLSEKEHVRARSDMYVGSKVIRRQDKLVVTQTPSRPYSSPTSSPLPREGGVVDEGMVRITNKGVETSDAFVNVFGEALSNAVDHVARSQGLGTPVTDIRIAVSPDGVVSILNDGFPIELEADENGRYSHTRIFGELRCGSNFDDSVSRENVAGRNGVGVSLLNIFSKWFRVRSYDAIRGKQFSQIWEDNSEKESEPIINTNYYPVILSDETDPDVERDAVANTKKGHSPWRRKRKRSYTCVSWKIDWDLLGIKDRSTYTDDEIGLLLKLVYDACINTSLFFKGVNFSFNGEDIPVRTIQEYGKLVIPVGDDLPEENFVLQTDKVKCLMTWVADQGRIHSFINGVYTPLGGTHVDEVMEKVFRPIIKKHKFLTMADIKKHIIVTLFATTSTPVFESQAKNRLESPFKWAVQPSMLKNIHTKVPRWELISMIKQSKELLTIKKMERTKRSFIKIDGLDPANKAGTSESRNCTLIMVEGLSAKTYAVQGMERGLFGKKGRDYIGVYPLRGKCLNVRSASVDMITKNKVVSDIIKSLNLKMDVDYTIEKNFKSLSYGRVCLLCDADADGLHIASLVQNMFHFMYPSLFDRKEPFLYSLQTPIVRVYLKGNKDLLFYDERRYNEYVDKCRNNNTKINKKYFKGLGASNAKDIEDTFGKKIVRLISDTCTGATLTKVFGKKQSDVRKKWMADYDPTSQGAIQFASLTSTPEEVTCTMSDYLNTETIKFSMADCERSIPNLMDGLKESQRKVLWSCFLRSLSYGGKTLKVAQLSGYVAEKTHYAHGETNLFDTVSRLAQDYPGSNNIPLLFRDGQFGSRQYNGKDAASARYIYTKLDRYTRDIFKSADEPLLTHKYDDGDRIEPVYFTPVIPMVLVNGVTAAIATGWSSYIPSYHPFDVIQMTKDRIKGKQTADKFKPWYRGYTGRIDKDDENNRYVTYGRVKQVRVNRQHVDELPVGMSINAFKEQLDELYENKLIKSYTNHSTPNTPSFTIIEDPNNIRCTLKTLKLHSYLSLRNLVLFTPDNRLKRYESIQQILDEFYEERIKVYIARREYIIKNLKRLIRVGNNKHRFLTAVLAREVEIFGVEDHEIEAVLVKDGYDREDEEEGDEEGDEEDTKSGGYEYLLRLNIRNMTQSKLAALRKEIDKHTKELEEIEGVSPEQLWFNDLDDLRKRLNSPKDYFARSKITAKQSNDSDSDSDNAPLTQTKKKTKKTKTTSKTKK